MIFLWKVQCYECKVLSGNLCILPSFLPYKREAIQPMTQSYSVLRISRVCISWCKLIYVKRCFVWIILTDYVSIRYLFSISIISRSNARKYLQPKTITYKERKQLLSSLYTWWEAVDEFDKSWFNKKIINVIHVYVIWRIQ